MAGDGSEVLSDELHRWVDEKAAELGVSRGEVLARALTAFREVDEIEAVRDGEGETEGDGDANADLAGAEAAALDARLAALDERVAAVERDGVDPERVTALADSVEELTERLTEAEGDADAVDPEALLDRLDRLDERVAALDAALDEKIEDVRERVVQVKREADEKAPAGHDHPEIGETADRAAAAAADLREQVDDLAARVDEGFDNFEEVLEYLTETSDELEGRATTLARATIDLRERVAELETERSARAVAEDIRATANRNGDATATCEACSRTVRVGLLSRPECPHCATTFEDVEPSRGLFGSATLLTGRPPALAGETTTAESPADLFADGDPDGADTEGRADDE